MKKNATFSLDVMLSIQLSQFCKKRGMSKTQVVEEALRKFMREVDGVRDTEFDDLSLKQITDIVTGFHEQMQKGEYDKVPDEEKRVFSQLLDEKARRHRLGYRMEQRPEDREREGEIP